MLRSIGGRETLGKSPGFPLCSIREKRCGVTHFTELHRTLHKNFPIRRSVSGVNGLPELGVSVLHGKNTSLRQAPDLAIMGKTSEKELTYVSRFFFHLRGIRPSFQGRPWAGPGPQI